MGNTRQVEAQVAEPTKHNGKIVAIIQTNKFANRMLVETTSEEFDSFDENQNKVKTTSFGSAVGNFVNMVSKHVPFIGGARGLFSNGNIPVGILAMLFAGAEIEFTRTFKKKGDKRPYGGSPYENDCYATEITKVILHTDPMSMTLVQSALQSAMTAPKAAMTLTL